MADEVLHAGVRGVTDLIVMPGLINLDFADIKSVISEMGKAVMGTGEAEGEDRALRAAEMAISNPLLDDVSMKGAKGVLINITGGPDLMLFEVEKAADRIRAEVDPDANIIFGNTILDEMEGRIRVSVVATGIDAEQTRQPEQRKITPIRPHLKPSVFTVESPRPVAAANPVARQVEQLANELNAPHPAADEAYILGGSDAPEMPARQTSFYPATETVRSSAEMPLAPKHEAERKAGWGFFGRKKPPVDQRQEPRPAPRPQAQPTQAASQGLNIPLSAGEDLFPEQSRDEQFEIPAFLRRQSN
jgi:cell division protein FtsZ